LDRKEYNFDFYLEHRVYFINHIDKKTEQDLFFIFNSIIKDNLNSKDIGSFILYIDSFGGDANPAFGISRLISNTEIPVYTFVTGSAMSAASLISINGIKRFAFKDAIFMLHNVEGVNYGTALNLKRQSDYVIMLNNKAKQIYKSKTKLPKSIINDIYEKQLEIYLDAKEALRYKLIDEII